MRTPDLPRLGRRLALIAGAAPALLALAAAPAAATTYCVGFERADCVTGLTAAEAFDAAVDGDRIELGDVQATAALDDAGRKLEIVGAGEGVTQLEGGLTLSDAESTLTGATVHDLTLTGTAGRVEVVGAAVLRGAARLQGARVRGTGVDAAAGTPRLDTVVVDQATGPALRVRCGAVLQARHVTLTGTPGELVQTDCATARADVAESILWGPTGAGFAGPGTVTTDHADYREQPGHTAGPGDRHDPPGFVPGSARLAAGSPLIDAGTPGALDPAEWPEDGDGLPRVADGSGDGTLVRDLGAFELPPQAVPLPPGNLLADPSAEEGTGWGLGGGFTRERYGSFPFPSAAAGGALAAGDVFFAGGVSETSSAGQVVPVLALAPEIDLGVATASLAGLLGGFRSDADRGLMRATFLGPAGQPLGAAELAAPTAAERGNASALLTRSRTDPIPPLTRSIAVTLQATHDGGGSYNDAYFDNLALSVAAPGAPRPPGAGDPPPKPFAGVLVLSGRARLDRRGRVPVRLGCASATVGRCTGVVTLVGALRRRAAAQRLRDREGQHRRRALALRAAADREAGARRSPAPRADPHDAVRRRPRRAGAHARLHRAAHGAAAPALTPASRPAACPQGPRPGSAGRRAARASRPAGRRRPGARPRRSRGGAGRPRPAGRPRAGPPPPSVPSAIQRSTRSRCAGQREQVRPHGWVVGPVGGLRHARDERGAQPRRRPRHREPGALRVALHRTRRAPHRRPQDPPDERLEHLVAPLLRALRVGAQLGVGGQERRLGRAPVEVAQDRARAEHAGAVLEPHARHRRPAEAQLLRQLVHDGDQLDAPVRDVLELQRPLDDGAGMRGGDRVQHGGHGRPSIIADPPILAAPPRRGSRSSADRRLAKGPPCACAADRPCCAPATGRHPR